MEYDQAWRLLSCQNDSETELLRGIGCHLEQNCVKIIQVFLIDILAGKPHCEVCIIGHRIAENRKMLMSKKLDLNSMSVDEMWQLHEEISQVLSVRLTSEKRQLEKRLAQLRRESETRQSESGEAHSFKDAPRERRKYPRVYPKYRNPKEPSETWSGRGKQPRWLAAALKTGHSIEEFAIGNVESTKNTKHSGRRQRA